ncbi:ASCH domain-containing protein [Xenorhabdus vietnamensis]|uniref:ASCH domain-containing protein n=1 Tax=Xenorhabdus vietnamensis TaxID=351656 RepID=A0A1Y2SBZ0_9GAMM|nr:ASCH domain-containing protein [Xenorhabdus vietnamensis]OTA15741.1 ASCH domain-containing protein [Xenorhabdus vietnamensis]
MKTNEVMELIESKYPKSGRWVFGDSPAMHDELAQLVTKGIKTATTCPFYAYHSYESEDGKITVGNYYIVFDSKEHPVCVARVTAMHLMQFSEMTEELAWKEGEGDRSLLHWQLEHQRFFEKIGDFSPEMEIVVIEFKVAEVL